MGYYSRYEIAIEDRRPSPATALENLRRDVEDARYALDEDGTPSGEESKWYDWISDMKAFSARHPGLLFKVRREGEEPGDIEVGYFLDGKHQGGKAEVRLPDFVEPGGSS